MSRLIGALNSGQKHKIIGGGYGGWIRFMYQSGKISRGRMTYKYNHGSGGNAPVTRGVIQTKQTGRLLRQPKRILHTMVTIIKVIL